MREEKIRRILYLLCSVKISNHFNVVCLLESGYTSVDICSFILFPKKTKQGIVC